MMNIENNVYGILAGSTPVTNLFSTRIYPVIVPYDSALPAIAYRINSIEPFEAQERATNLEKYIVRISIFSKTYGSLYQNCAAVIAAMVGHTDSALSRIFHLGASDDVEEIYTTGSTSESTGQYLFIRHLDFSIFKK